MTKLKMENHGPLFNRYCMERDINIYAFYFDSNNSISWKTEHVDGNLAEANKNNCLCGNCYKEYCDLLLD